MPALYPGDSLAALPTLDDIRRCGGGARVDRQLVFQRVLMAEGCETGCRVLRALRIAVAPLALTVVVVAGWDTPSGSTRSKAVSRTRPADVLVKLNSNDSPRATTATTVAPIPTARPGHLLRINRIPP